MFTYQAPNPYPPTLWSRMTSWLPTFSTDASKSSQALLGKMILPAQLRDIANIREEQLDYYARNLDVDFGVVNTHDGAKISTIEIKTKKPSDLYIIKCNGNGTLYEGMIDEFTHDAIVLNVNVIGFNYRSVNHSTGKAAVFQELVTDGIAQVQRLLSQGIPAKNILLDGHSLGGAVATEVAAHFHQTKQRVYLWNSSSFASLSQAAAGILNQKDILPTCIEDTAAYSSASMMKPLGWEVNPARSYLKIPASHRGYMVVSKKSGDGVITHAASLHMGVKASEKKQGVMTGYRVKAQGPNVGHNTSRHRLFNTKDASQSAQAIFEAYVKSHLGS